ncbi:MAG TPA: PQQ-dependent sugar dehydrogenase [Acidimicrobiia bacterium]|nr:PQQ-dependent sugar dehydrogenase [Acidimicrobiia bacterium]
MTRTTRAGTLFACLALLATMFPAPALANDGLALVRVGGNFSSPLYATAPAGDSRLFVVEQGGLVKVVKNNTTSANPYIDARSLITSPRGGEQGLLGMAFHPGFTSNGKVYISYTDSGGALRVSELTVDPTADSVNLSSLRTIIRVPQPAPNHNGGMILFGPDRLFYLGLGDGGGSGDPDGNGQNINTLLGSILRINVDSDAFPGDSLRNYSVPSSNPFVGKNGADEIYIYGLRNPWRFWIDPPTGRFYIGDVGQSSREEVTILEPGQAPGANLGWDRLEGTQCYPPGTTCSSAGTVLPQIEYGRSGGAGSVTGGMVYRGRQIPSLVGTYFYGDFLAGWVRSFRYNGSVTAHVTHPFGTSLVSSFGIDGRGEMYVVSLGGSVWRIVGPDNDEMFFYRDDGLFRYYDVRPDGTLPGPILQGDDYTPGWDAITSVDLDGDGQDEMFFYRDDGLFRYYNIAANGRIGTPILAGDGYTTGWDVITSVDLD